MKLFDSKPKYVRLDDDVSFQLMRTNPKLTTNIKLMYDGENIYMDSYSATPLLSSTTYKNYSVLKTGFYNCDVKRFLIGSSSGAYELGHNMDDTIVGSNYDNQFENIYWCGAESINSSVYPQELGFIAPLYLRKKRPDYFVIFKTNTPANTNLVDGDTVFNFKDDVIKNAKIIKAFDLREGAPIGDYINNYVSQKGFKYDQSIYVNFSAKEMYYYGIDKTSGVLCQKVENFETQLLENDNTIIKSDEWITCGFERNNLIFPYILNLEFLFDDNETEEYKFARYFGMYCNSIDLYDCLIDGFTTTKKTNNTYNKISFVSGTKPDLTMNSNMFYYVKDKDDNIYSVDSNYNVFGQIDTTKYMGYETESVSIDAEKINELGYATLVISLSSDFKKGDRVYITDKLSTKYTEKSESEEVDYTHYFSATDSTGLNPGKHSDKHFSCQGERSDQLKAFATMINDYGTDGKWVKAYVNGNRVIVKSKMSGSSFNKKFELKIERASGATENYTYFMGGTDAKGCLLKIKTSDVYVFASVMNGYIKEINGDRYIKCYDGRDYSKVLGLIPYIENNTIDDNYWVVVCDKNGRYINNTRSNIEILDKYKAKIGVLSFFPVKDFDFDTMKSAYGEDTMMKKEINNLDVYLEKVGKDKTGKSVVVDVTIEVPDEDADTSLWDLTLTKTESNANAIGNITTSNLPYNKFSDAEGNGVDNEYEYFCENLIPELTTVNKTTQFVSKWGYMDEGKDSCETPYRLNMSKIFDTANFSANTFMQECDIYEYTHSMPYYVDYNGISSSNNEYQYVVVDDDLMVGDSINELKAKWRNKFTSITDDAFTELFGDISTTKFNSKRFNKKYSRFLLGSNIAKPTTLFRGVKFEIEPIQNGKVVNTSKYNDYRFVFLYVPVNVNGYENDGVYFIKNDTFKFIVGLMFVNAYLEEVATDMRMFNKIYMYSGTLGFDIYTETSESKNAVTEIMFSNNAITLTSDSGTVTNQITNMNDLKDIQISIDNDEIGYDIEDNNIVLTYPANETTNVKVSTVTVSGTTKNGTSVMKTFSVTQKGADVDSVVPITELNITYNIDLNGDSDTTTYYENYLYGENLYIPANTTQRGTKWVISKGSEYAKIVKTTTRGIIVEFVQNKNADGKEVEVRLVSTADSNVYDSITKKIHFVGSTFEIVGPDTIYNNSNYSEYTINWNGNTEQVVNWSGTLGNCDLYNYGGLINVMTYENKGYVQVAPQSSGYAIIRATLGDGTFVDKLITATSKTTRDLLVSPTDYVVDSNEHTLPIFITHANTTTVGWNASSDADWIILSKTDDSKTSDYYNSISYTNFKVSENTTDETRTGNITFTLGTSTKTVMVVQTKKSADTSTDTTVENVSLTFDKTNIVIPYSVYKSSQTSVSVEITSSTGLTNLTASATRTTYIKSEINTTSEGKTYVDILIPQTTDTQSILDVIMVSGTTSRGQIYSKGINVLLVGNVSDPFIDFNEKEIRISADTTTITNSIITYGLTDTSYQVGSSSLVNIICTYDNNHLIGQDNGGRNCITESFMASFDKNTKPIERTSTIIIRGTSGAGKTYANSFKIIQEASTEGYPYFETDDNVEFDAQYDEYPATNEFKILDPQNKGWKLSCNNTELISVSPTEGTGDATISVSLLKENISGDEVYAGIYLNSDSFPMEQTSEYIDMKLVYQKGASNPLKSMSIVGAKNILYKEDEYVGAEKTFTIDFNPTGTSQRNVNWAITSGSEYVESKEYTNSINEEYESIPTAQFKFKTDVDSIHKNVVISCVSKNNPNISTSKTLTLIGTTDKFNVLQEETGIPNYIKFKVEHDFPYTPEDEIQWDITGIYKDGNTTTNYIYDGIVRYDIIKQKNYSGEIATFWIYPSADGTYAVTVTAQTRDASKTSEITFKPTFEIPDNITLSETELKYNKNAGLIDLYILSAGGWEEPVITYQNEDETDWINIPDSCKTSDEKIGICRINIQPTGVNTPTRTAVITFTDKGNGTTADLTIKQWPTSIIYE